MYLFKIFFYFRMEIYKHVLNMLDSLYTEDNQNQTPSNLFYDNQYTTNQSLLLDGLDQTKLGSTVSLYYFYTILLSLFI